MADIVNFTAYSEKVSADEVVALLDGMFSRFDDVVDEYGVEKIKTIGDSYMIVAGVPTHREDHATVLYQLSSELHKIANEFTHNQSNPIKLRIAELIPDQRCQGLLANPNLPLMFGLTP